MAYVAPTRTLTSPQRQTPPCTCRRIPPIARGTASKRGRGTGRGRAAKRSALYDALSAYSAHFIPLLEEERSAEQAATLAARDSSKSRTLLVEAGIALFDLRVYAPKRRRVYSNAIFALRYPGNKPLPDAHTFSVGDLVSIETDETLEATIISRSKRSLEVAVPLSSAAYHVLDALMEQNTSVDVYRGTSVISYERAVAALQQISNPANQVTQITRILALSHASRNIVDEQFNKRSFDPIPDLMREGRAGGEWEERARESVRTKATPWVPSPLLNPAQIRAVRATLSRTVSLVQGPPGTGKTTTAGHIVIAALKERRGPVLAAAASNTAADALLAAILRIGGRKTRVVRVGRLGAVVSSLWEHTLDAAVERDPAVSRLLRQGDGAALAAAEKAAAHRVVKNADVVVCTCIGAGREVMANLNFPFVLVDEATQATEPAVQVALLHGARQLVLTGDHHQLNPTVISDARELGVSLFRRLWDAGIESFLLDTQYRMHPAISAFPGRRFYNSRIRDAVTEVERPLPPGIVGTRLDIGAQTLFIDVAGEEVRGVDRDADGLLMGFSYSNEAEASVVVQLLRILCCTDGFRPESVGVISPYSAQPRMIRRLVKDKLVEVKTVDGFQGREKEVIVMTTVRCNENREVGFLSDWKRLNVALTRARTLLIVVGSQRTLGCDENWRSWLQFISRAKGVLEFPPIAEET